VGGLLQIAPGELVSYEQVARAVGTAVGANPVALLIPCHRVIRKVGDLGGYRWGLARKRALIAREANAASSFRVAARLVAGGRDAERGYRSHAVESLRKQPGVAAVG